MRFRSPPGPTEILPHRQGGLAQPAAFIAANPIPRNRPASSPRPPYLYDPFPAHIRVIARFAVHLPSGVVLSGTRSSRLHSDPGRPHLWIPRRPRRGDVSPPSFSAIFALFAANPIHQNSPASSARPPYLYDPFPAHIRVIRAFRSSLPSVVGHWILRAPFSPHAARGSNFTRFPRRGNPMAVSPSGAKSGWSAAGPHPRPCRRRDSPARSRSRSPPRPTSR